MIAAFRRILRKITPAEVAAKELADAELSMLEAQTAKEYAESVMAYNDARIRRLRKYLAYMELGRTPAEPEPAERRRQDRAIYLIAVITLAVLAAVI